jgi:hypothetical protein
VLLLKIVVVISNRVVVMVAQEWVSYGNGFSRHIVALTKFTTNALSLFGQLKFFSI